MKGKKIECWGRNEVKRNTEQANFVNIKEAESQKIERQIGMGGGVKIAVHLNFMEIEQKKVKGGWNRNYWCSPYSLYVVKTKLFL